jgi:serine/threonine protein phosphatase PrpC
MITHIVGDGHRFRLCVAALSEQGMRSVNEDDLGMIEVSGRGMCCVLADGAGGHGNGSLAAQLTVAAVLDGFRETPLFSPAGLASLISQAEQTVSSEQPSSVSRKYMSSTVVLLAIEPFNGRALWAHWGDSRLYWFRQGKVHQMTEDHSMVQQLLQAGIYRNKDPRDLPNRSMLAGAIGADSQVPPSVLGEPVELQIGDALLLCSDGLWESLRETDMERCLEGSSNISLWLVQMKELILAQKNPNQDNFSALVVWVGANDEHGESA